VQGASYDRIASLTVMTDEILWQLTKGKERKKVLSLSPLARNLSYSCIANEISDLKEIPSYSVEQIVAMKPNLVLAANFNRPSILKFLKESSIKYELFETSGSFSDLWKNITKLGDILDQKSSSRKMIDKLKKRLQSFKTPKKKLNLISYSSELFFPGTESSFNYIVKAIKHRNITAGIKKDKSWVRLSSEALITLPIDYIVVGLRPNTSKKEMITEISNNDKWKHLTAVKQKKFLFIPNAYLLSLSQCMVDATEMLNREIDEQQSR